VAVGLSRSASLAFVVPGDVDAPTGGNVWDRRVRDALAGQGWAVGWHPVSGTWPRPGREAVDALDRVLAGLPDGSAVLLDGLVACGVPDVVERNAGRLRTSVVVHLPLALETGLPTAEVDRLAAAERRVLAAVERVVVTSRWCADLLAGHALRHAPVVASPGVDPAPDVRRTRGEVAPGDGDPTRDSGGHLLCVASVTPRKGQRLLVEALSRPPDDVPWTLHLVGAQPDPDEVAALLHERDRAGLQSRVHLHGPLTGDALEEQWRGADLLVLPSHVETFGMVVTEALARGLPVLSTTGSAVGEALGTTSSGPPGVLVPPGDVTALATALRHWLTDAALRDRLRRRARERSQTLSGWDATADAVASGLADLVTPRVPS
jgi:glycosyltransferase involved in cell wall biosynthesis